MSILSSSRHIILLDKQFQTELDIVIYFKHYSFSEHLFYRILGHFIFLHFMTRVYYQGCI